MNITGKQNLFKSIKTYVKIVIDYIFPSLCLKCKVKIKHLGFCEHCALSVRPLSNNSNSCPKCYSDLKEQNAQCLNCKLYSPNIDFSKSFFAYQGHIKQSIKQMKYQDDTNLAYFFAGKILEMLKQIKCNKIVITNAAMHAKQLHKRMFNQSALMAMYVYKKSLQEKLNVTYMPNFFIKTIDTKKQSTLGRDERLQNLKGSIEVCNKSQLKDDERLILIDDIITTGGTVNEHADALNRKHGNQKLIILSVARTLID